MTAAETILLGGVKHCGKSSVGANLAELLQRPFADTDSLAEALYRERTGEKLSCREIFRTAGAEAFRRLEADAVAAAVDGMGRKGVFALGGGAAANGFICWEKIKALKIMLDIPAETVKKRILADGIPPFLGSDIREFEANFPGWFAAGDAKCREWADMIFVPDTEADAPENARLLLEKIRESWLR